MSRSPRFERWVPALLGALVVIGATLRFYRLTFQSLWLDELFSVVVSRSEMSVVDIVKFYVTDTHPVVYPLLLHFWMIVFGETEFVARALSAVMGIVGIPVMYLIGRRLGGVGWGLVAAALVAFNPFHIAYSQEARSYTVVFVMAALSYGALILLLHAPTWRRAVAWGVVTGIAAHVHYYALVMLAGQMAAGALVLAVRRDAIRSWLRLATGPAIVAVSVLPWMSAVRRVATLDRFWSPLPEPLFFVDYFHRFFGQDLTVSVVAGGLLLALPLILRGRAAASENGEVPSPRLVAAVLATSVAVSLLAAYVRSHLVVPMLMPRFALVFMPAVLLLITMAICGLRPPKVRAILTLALAVLSLVGLVRSEYYTQPRKEQWREAVQSMVSHPRFADDSDRCLAVLAPGFQYYADRLAPGFEVAELTLEELEAVVAEGPPLPVLWLLLPRGELPDDDFRKVQRRLWGRTDRIEHIRMVVERWHPRRRPWDPESATASEGP